MLAVHRPRNNGGTISSDIISRRGRSRQVSRTALARQASEERRASCAMEWTHSPRFSPSPSSSMLTLGKVSQTAQFCNHFLYSLISQVSIIPVPVNASFSTRSASPSPLSSVSTSPDQPESPPPQLSLEDQVHEAYALEDIHLAKILLLRLKGIEVTSDDDPRIAAVQDEDFDICFLPNGPLLNEQDEQALKDLQARELERIEELRRVERMRMCERKWIEEKQRLRDQRVAEFRRRERKRLEEEQRLLQAKEEERRRLVEEEQRRASKVASTLWTKARADRKFFNYDHLASKLPSSDREQPFVYNYMVTGPSLLALRQPTTPSPLSRTNPLFPTPSFDESRTISFKDVFRCMEGQLFPLTDDERICRSSSPAHSRSRTSSRRRDVQLLDALLAEVQYTGEERTKLRGKGQERCHFQRYPVCLACSACRSPLPSPSSTQSSSSAVSRTSSWLSFKTSSSLSSSYTDLTTPSSSPMASRKSSWLASRPQSWIPVPTLTEILPPPKPLLRHSCRAYNRLTPISLSETPLVIEVSTPSPISMPLSYEGSQRSSSRVRTTKEGAGLLAKRVSKFVELAKNIQSAYVTAALFSVTMSYEDNQEFFSTKGNSGIMNSVNRTLRPPGSRASQNDVKIFLTLPTVSIRCEDDSQCSPPPKCIPLTSPFPPTEPPRTILPDPLPYQLHFNSVPQPIRSPFHHASSEMHTMYPGTQCLSDALSQVPSGQLSWRIRCVGNPAYLRLKAVQNIVWKNGIKWEGCGRDTAMGGGRERVIGIAYEGVGRSNLSYSLSTSA